MDSAIVGWGSARVTAEGSDNAMCNMTWGFEQVSVECCSPNNERVDSRFRVLLES